MRPSDDSDLDSAPATGAALYGAVGHGVNGVLLLGGVPPRVGVDNVADQSVADHVGAAQRGEVHIFHAVEDVPDDPQAAAITTAIIELGAALGMTTVAEGVTSEAQRRFLVERGCPVAQGFHFAKPLPADEATERLRAVVLGR